jgi:hypothetical protein
VAVSTHLGCVVVANVDTKSIAVFTLGRGGLVDRDSLWTFGSRGSGPLQFRFDQRAYGSGFLCFTQETPPTLLVSDAYNNKVEEVAIDVARKVAQHRGYVVHPTRDTTTSRVVHGPRGVAASATRIAVSAWRAEDPTAGDHLVHLFDAKGDRALSVRLVSA